MGVGVEVGGIGDEDGEEVGVKVGVCVLAENNKVNDGSGIKVVVAVGVSVGVFVKVCVSVGVLLGIGAEV